MLALAVHTVSGICSASDDCALRLDRIEEEIEETSGIEGARVLRFRLEECLQGLREQTRHLREEMSQSLVLLQEQLEVAQGNEGGDGEIFAPQLDKISGLEAREAAERALAAATKRSGLSYAALFVMDRLHLINAEFGYSTGDRLLRAFCGHLKSFLVPEDQLFRWTGPAFVAVLERSEEPAEIQSEIERITSFKLEAAVQIGNRSVLLPIAGTSLLLPLAEGSALADVTRRMDAFTGQQARR